MQLKLRDLLNKIRSLPNEMTMWRICTSIVNCGSRPGVNYIVIVILMIKFVQEIVIDGTEHNVIVI